MGQHKSERIIGRSLRYEAMSLFLKSKWPFSYSGYILVIVEKVHKIIVVLKGNMACINPLDTLTFQKVYCTGNEPVESQHSVNTTVNPAVPYPGLCI